MTQVGALQTAPILIAVVTSFLAMEGVKYLMASRKKAQPGAQQPESDAMQDLAARVATGGNDVELLGPETLAPVHSLDRGLRSIERRHRAAASSRPSEEQ